MNLFYDGDHLETDFDVLRANAETSRDVELLDALLTQISESSEAAWSLTQWPGENTNPHFNVKGIECLQRRGYNCYRLRPLGRRLKQYRIIYAYDSDDSDFYILAIVRKVPDVLPEGATREEYYDYQINHPITLRICDEYESFDIRRLR